MALGDKKPVVMEEDRGIPGGVATLDENGKLVQMPTAADVGAVNKAGDTMTGNLTIMRSLPCVSTAEITTGRGARMIALSDGSVSFENITVDGTKYRSINISPETTDVSSGLKLYQYDGTSWYEQVILHTGNKPYNFYTGNGSAEERVIETGGIGSVVAIWSNHASCYVTLAGGFTLYGGSVIGFESSQVTFANGAIKIKTTHDAFNASGVNYGYQVL